MKYDKKAFPLYSFNKQQKITLVVQGYKIDTPKLDSIFGLLLGCLLQKAILVDLPLSFRRTFPTAYSTTK
jgi:hypothetical protein